MKVLSSLFALFAFIPVVALSAPRFTDEGLELNAGTLGKFTLEYPQLLGVDQQSAHKLREKVANGGTAILKYAMPIAGTTRTTCSSAAASSRARSTTNSSAAPRANTSM
jgi:hypothetical protein